MRIHLAARKDSSTLNLAHTQAGSRGSQQHLSRITDRRDQALRPMFRFTIRDLLWWTVVVAVWACAWKGWREWSLEIERRNAGDPPPATVSDP